MTEHHRPSGSIRPGFAEADWNERYTGRELVWTAEPNRLFAAEIADLPAGRALDLACGEGRNAVWLAERGWRVTGVDFAAVGLAKARDLAASRGVEVDWVHADLLQYEPEAGVFDLVAILYLQVPHDELDVVLRRAATAVARGGTLLVLGHDTTNLRDGHGGPKDVSVLFTPGGRRRLARRARRRAGGEGAAHRLACRRSRGGRDRRVRPRPAAHRAFLGRRRRPSPAPSRRDSDWSGNGIRKDGRAWRGRSEP